TPTTVISTLSLHDALPISRERGRADDSLDREARKDLREIAARYNPLAVDVLKRIVGWMFRRIYDGVDVDAAGMKRLAQASARARSEEHTSELQSHLNLVCR